MDKPLSPSSVQEPAMPTTQPFRLLDLPCELRLKIYDYLLAPTGVISLTSTASHRLAVIPQITTTLLRSCKAINQEATDILYEDNEVCTVVDAQETCWPIISEARLPQHALQKIRRLCMILDCTTYNFRANYDSDVNFTPFEALASLKSLRLSLLYRKLLRWGHVEASYGQPKDLSCLLQQIMERIPADTQIITGIDKAQQPQQFAVLKYLWNKRDQGSWGMGPNGLSTSARSQDLDLLDLTPHMAAIQSREFRGTKLGATKDVFAEIESSSATEP